MIVQLAGSRFVLGGSFTRPLSKRVLSERLVDAGATVGTTVNAQTAAVILGAVEWVTDVEGRARRLGLPVLTEAQALELLAQGSLTLEDADEPDTPLDALVGEARSLLDGEPSSRIWDALVALLDRCAPEHEPALTDCLEPALDRWSVPADTRYDTTGTSADYRDHYWAAECPPGVLRVFPRHWITAALQDGDLDRFRLARALVLPKTELSNADVERLLGLDTLSGLNYVDLRGYGPTPSGRVFAALARSASLPHLEELRLETFKKTHARSLDKGTPHRLSRLRLSLYAGSYDDAAIDELTHSTWVTHLDVLIHDLYGLAQYVGAPDLRPIEGLSRLTLWSHTWLDLFMDYFPTSPRADTLSLAGDITSVNSARLRQMLDQRVELAPNLDLSDLRAADNGMVATPTFRGTSMNAAFLKHLPGSAFCASFEAIRLGHWYTEARADALEAHGLTVLDRTDTAHD